MSSNSVKKSNNKLNFQQQLQNLNTSTIIIAASQH